MGYRHSVYSVVSTSFRGMYTNNNTPTKKLPPPALYSADIPRLTYTDNSSTPHLSISWSLSSSGSPLGILELKRGGTALEGVGVGGGPTELANDLGMSAGRALVGGGSGDGVGETPSSMSSFGGDPESAKT
jgi:hypothetical protein